MIRSATLVGRGNKHIALQHFLTTLIISIFYLFVSVPSPLSALTFVEAEINVEGLTAASSVAASEDGKTVYATGFNSNAVVVFSQDASGQLTPVQVVRNSDINDGLNGANAIAISPDSKHVYVASVINDAVVAFTRNVTDGKLTLAGLQKNGVADASGQTVTGLGGASNVAVSPDGTHVFVTAIEDNALVAFERNPSTGVLKWLQTQKNGVNNVAGLSSATGLTVSPDNNTVYVASSVDNAVTVFRKTATESISFAGIYREGENAVSGLLGAYGLALSPEGTHLYVASSGQNAVAVFNSDPATGGLTPVEVDSQGKNGITGLTNVRTVLVHPNGREVYAAGTGDNALVVFNREPTTGKLTYQTTITNVTIKTESLSGITALATTRSGTAVYTAALVSNAISVFGLAAADLEVTGVDSSPVAINSALTYTFTITNKGVSPATNVVLTDTLPSGVTFTSATPTSCTHTSGTVTCALGSLDVNASTTVTLVVTTPATVGTGTLKNLVIVSSAQSDSNLTNNQIETNSTLKESVPVTDLSITVTTPSDTAGLNLPLTYTVVVSNQGPETANQVIITPTFPSGVTIGTLATQCTTVAAVTTCKLDKLEKGTTQNIDFSITTPATIPAAPLTFSATVKADESDPTPANNTAKKDVTVSDVSVDLAVTDVVAEPNSVSVGNVVTYTVTVANNGTAVANNVILSGTLSPKVKFEAKDNPSCTQNKDGTLQCTLDSIANTAPNNVKVTKIKTTAIQAGTEVAAVFKVAGGGAEATPTNNTGQTSITITGTMADFVVTVKADKNPVQLNEQLGYTIEVTNNGPDPSGFTLNGTLSGNNVVINSIAAEGGKGICGSGASFECAFAPLIANEKVSIAVKVTPTGTGSVTLKVDVNPPADTFDSTTPNSAQQQVAVGNAVVDLSVTLLAEPSPVLLGNTLNYTATVKNEGTIQTNNVVFTQTLPSGIKLATPAPTATQGEPCTETEGIVACQLGPIDGGKTVTVLVAVIPSSVGTLTTTAEVKGDTLDIQTNNNVSKLETTVSQSQSDLSLTMTTDHDVSKQPFFVDNSFSYQLVVSNAGPDNASGITVTDTLPATLTFLSAQLSPQNKGQCVQSNDKVICTINSLAAPTTASGTPGVGETVTITLTLQPKAAGTLLNTARVEGKQADPNNQNNTASLSTRINNPSTLYYVGAAKDGLDGVQGLQQVSDIAVSPDGKNLYAVGFGDNSLVTFQRITDGTLSFVQVLRDASNGVEGLAGASSVALSPDGDFVYATGFSKDAVSVFKRDSAKNGMLTFVQAVKNGNGGVDGIAGAFNLVVLSDYVYVAGINDNAIVVFKRDITTGSLSFIEAYKDGATLQGLKGVTGLAVNPEGTYLFAVSTISDSLTVFSRNTSTGRLTFLQNFTNGSNAIQGLDAATGVAVSPDGKQVYVAAGGISNAVSVFALNQGLTYIQTLRTGENGTSGLAGAYDVLVSSSGDYVYVTASEDNALVVFSRDANTGQLRYVDNLQSGVNGVEGLRGARSVATSPAGGHIYVAGFADNAIALLRVKSADVSAVVESNANTINVGGELAYTITLKNNGPDTASDVSVEIAFPPDVSLISLTPQVGSCSPPVNNKVACSVGQLTNGASTTLNAVVNILRAATLRTQATVSASQLDPNPDNNTGLKETQALAVADVVVSMKATPDPVVLNGQLTYVITVTNNGPNMANQIVATDTLPSKTVFVSASVNDNAPGCLNQAELMTVTCQVDSLNPGADATIKITVIPTVGGLLNNTVALTTGSADPNIANNSLSQTVDVKLRIIEKAVDNTGKELRDYVITPTGAVKGGQLSGTLINQGLILDARILSDGLVQGGTLSGTITNEGVLENVHLMDKAIINGGTVRGTVEGIAAAPATLNSRIAAGTVLSHVILAAGAVLDPKAIIGPGVRFANNSTIPAEMNLTAALPTLNNTLTQSAVLDLSTDVVVGGISLLAAINALPDLRNNTLAFTQSQETGHLMLPLGADHILLYPVAIRQAAVNQAMGITVNEDGSVIFVTEARRWIVTQPAIENPSALSKDLAHIGLSQIKAMPDGTVQFPTQGEIYFVARADKTTRLTDPFELLGIVSSPSTVVQGMSVVLFRYAAADSVRWQQIFYPAAAHQEELRIALKGIPDASDVRFYQDGTVSAKIAKRTYRGLFDYRVQTGRATNVTQLLIVPNANGDGSEDLRVVYANGDQQLLYVLPAPNWVSEVADIPQVKAGGYQVTQDAKGNLWLMQGDVRRYLHPVSIQQLDEGTPSRMTIAEDGHVELVTASGRLIILQPALQSFTALEAALQSLGSVTVTELENGNLNILLTPKANPNGLLLFSARPSLESTLAPLTASVGLSQGPFLLPNVAALILVFRDESGTKRQQVLYPAAKDLEGLRTFFASAPGVKTVEFGNGGSVTVTTNTAVYRGLFDYAVALGDKLPTGGFQFSIIPDANGDKVEDFGVTYGNGNYQIIYRLP